MDQAQRIENALKAVDNAFKAAGKTASGIAPDIALVEAGLELCEALSGFGDIFWSAIEMNPENNSAGLRILDDPRHAQKNVLPLCARFLRAFGFQPPDGAEEFVDQALRAYTAARQATADTVHRRVTEARIRVAALTSEICSLSLHAHEHISTRKPLDEGERTLLRRVVRKGGRVLMALIFLNGVLADTAGVTTYYEDHPKLQHEIVQEVEHLSDAGKDAIRILGLHEAARQSEDQQPRARPPKKK